MSAPIRNGIGAGDARGVPMDGGRVAGGSRVGRRHARDGSAEPRGESRFRHDPEATARDRDFPLGTCGLAPEWSRYGLAYEIAHKALGLQVHANLENPDYVAGPAEVLGAGVAKDAFCDNEALGRYVQMRVAAWQATFKALPKGAKPPPGISLTVRSFSFPFFDRTFRRAVVVWEYDDKSVAFDDKGERRRTTIDQGGTAVTYHRGAGGWRKVGEEDLYSAD